MFETLFSNLAEQAVVILQIRVHPSAAQTRLKGAMADGTLKIDVAAVPEHGKANTALVTFIAKEFGVPKSHVEILSGQMGKRKVVRITR